MDNLDSLKKQILAHQAEFPEAEVCGFIVFFDGNFEAIPANNVSKDKDLFVIDGGEYLKAKIAHRLCAVYHTHVHEDETPSEFDKISSDHTCLPFLIYGFKSDKFSLTIPEYVEADAEGVSKLKEAVG